MNIDTAGNLIYHYDMCAHCTLDTAGQHEPHCPLYQERQSITVKQPPEGWDSRPFGLSYSDWVKEQHALIDAHPEWGIEYL